METAARTLEAIDAEIARTKEALANVKGSETEVYARIVGYYRSVRNWNKGKRDEYNHRKMFVYDKANVATSSAAAETTKAAEPVSAVASAHVASTRVATTPARYELFARATCPNCPPVKEYMANVIIPGTLIDVDSEEGLRKASELGVFAAPTVIVYDANDCECARAHSVSELAAIFEPVAAVC
ncbi:MAG: hypothetical protein J6T84_01710 [Spirochaetaceae bacterium]|nr:hypothetical protein [Spirochaetaceae bacterium]